MTSQSVTINDVKASDVAEPCIDESCVRLLSGRYELTWKRSTQMSYRPLRASGTRNDLPTYESRSVDITSTISIMLEDSKYVRCLLIDFSKAFDSVDHLLLIHKLKMYNIADKWIVSFLTDRDQYTKLGDQRSFIRVINRSIV